MRNVILMIFLAAIASNCNNRLIGLVPDTTTVSNGVSLDKTALFLAPSQSGQLTATTNPMGQSVTWSSSDSSKVSVSSTGLVSKLAPTMDTITITASVGANSATAKVYPSGQMLVVLTGTTQTLRWDPATATFSLGGTLPWVVGAGTNATYISYGPYVGKILIMRGAVTTSASFYDPMSNLASLAPNLTSAIGSGALSFQINSGPAALDHIVITGNGTTNTSRFISPAAVFMSGPTTLMPITTGSQGFYVSSGLNAGRYVVATAIGANTVIFDPLLLIFQVGVPLTGAISADSFTFPILSGPKVGNQLVAHGSGTATSMYDQVTGAFISGPSTTCVTSAGAYSTTGIFGTNHKQLIICGSGFFNTSVYDAINHTFSTGPVTPFQIQSGAFALQITTGPYAGQSLHFQGGGTTNAATYDPATNAFALFAGVPVAINGGYAIALP